MSHKLTAKIASSYPVAAMIGASVEIQRVELVRPRGSKVDQLALMVSIDGVAIEYPMDPQHLENWDGSMAFEANQAVEKKMLKRHLLMVGQPYVSNCIGTQVVVRVGSEKSGEVFGGKSSIAAYCLQHVKATEKFVSSRWSERLYGDLQSYEVSCAICDPQGAVRDRVKITVRATLRCVVKAEACRQLRAKGLLKGDERVHASIKQVNHASPMAELRCDWCWSLILIAFGVGGFCAMLAMMVIWWLTGWLESKEKKGGRKL